MVALLHNRNYQYLQDRTQLQLVLVVLWQQRVLILYSIQLNQKVVVKAVQMLKQDLLVDLVVVDITE